MAHSASHSPFRRVRDEVSFPVPLKLRLTPWQLAMPKSIASKGGSRRKRYPATTLHVTKARIKRPENAWILFRKAQQKQYQVREPGRRRRQADISKLISSRWKALDSTEKDIWFVLAEEKKLEHAGLYPDYVYHPQRRKSRKQHPTTADAARVSQGNEAHV